MDFQSIGGLVTYAFSVYIFVKSFRLSFIRSNIQQIASIPKEKIENYRGYIHNGIKAVPFQVDSREHIASKANYIKEKMDDSLAPLLQISSPIMFLAVITIIMTYIKSP
jgi:hypothetical protein